MLKLICISSLQHLTKLKVQGDELSPVKHLYMQDDDLSVEEQDKFLTDLIDKVVMGVVKFLKPYR